MNRFSLLLFLVTTTSQLLYAQDNDNHKPRTLIDGSSGMFFSLNVKLGELNDQQAYFTGAEIGIIRKHFLNIGLKGAGLVTDVESDTKNVVGDPYQLKMSYGGIFVEPIISSENVAHFTFPVFIGIGGIGEKHDPLLLEDNIVNGINIAEDHELPIQTKTLLILEPGVNVELNLNRNIRLLGGVGYQMILSDFLPNLQGNEVNGLSTNLSLRIGWFR